jgi:hypothetical protein
MGYSTQFIVMDNKLSQKKNMGDRETIVIMHVYMYDLLTSKMEPIVSLVVIGAEFCRENHDSISHNCNWERAGTT